MTTVFLRFLRNFTDHFFKKRRDLDFSYTQTPKYNQNLKPSAALEKANTIQSARKVMTRVSLGFQRICFAASKIVKK